MRTDNGNRILEIIRFRVGREQAISAPEICRALGWQVRRERYVRRIIADESMLWSGVVVCSVSGHGFFVAENFDEVVAFESWLSDLAENAVHKRDQFREMCTRMGFRFPERRAA